MNLVYRLNFTVSTHYMHSFVYLSHMELQGIDDSAENMCVKLSNRK